MTITVKIKKLILGENNIFFIQISVDTRNFAINFWLIFFFFFFVCADPAETREDGRTAENVPTGQQQKPRRR